jgi:hypothetical protein
MNVLSSLFTGKEIEEKSKIHDISAIVPHPALRLPPMEF